MKIALVILHADPSRGGAERYTLDLAAALAKAGLDVSLLATSFAEVPPGVKEIKVDADALRRTGHYRRFLDALDAHLNAMSYDIVHAMLPVRRCDVYHPHAGIAADMTRPLDALVRPRRRAMANVERALLNGSQSPVVLCLSNYVKEFVERAYSLSEDRLATLFNAVDINRFAPMPATGVIRKRLRELRHVALMIANDLNRKGFPELLDAMWKLDAGKGWAVALVTNESDLRPWTMNRESPHGVILNCGSTDDPRPYYADADFFVLPTKHDPCSLVVLEALAMGLPVISTRFNGATEIMTDGIHGYILEDPTDADGLADRMRQLADPELRARMSRACLELRPKLAYEHHLSTLLELYTRIISKRKTHV